ncbi:branched-chain amino acid ABC transporter permease [Rhodospirillum sp. A1_3_36]|uniref:branched-chain amino acid ABC transporter permease n=1 Tax=Rhodospirillum sp. A1_3_36 TaxID=3391666 RepID=UPI0039A48CA3
MRAMDKTPTTGAPASTGGTGRVRWWTVAPLIVLAAFPFATGNIFHFHIAIMICLAIMATTGLAVIARVGQLSLCHGAFVGLGAYASVITVMRLELPFLFGPLVAVVLSVGVAALIGGPLLRLRGVYFVLITFALNELFRLVMLEFPSVSGGSSGIPGIPPAGLGPFVADTKPTFYVVALVAAAAVVGILWLIQRGMLGHRFAAVEENLALAESSGINTSRTQTLAFVIGSGIAGFTGSMMAHYIGFVSPETFGFQLSVSYIIMLVVGGRLALWGPVVGAMFLTPLPEFLRGAVEFQHVLYGLALILILQFLPGGLVSLPSVLARLGRRT